MNQMSSQKQSSLQQTMRSAKSLVIVGAVTIGLLMSVGYATLSQDISRTGRPAKTAVKESTYNVEIIDVAVLDEIGSATGKTPIYSGNKISFDSEIISPGDQVVYKITIKNNGTIAARLEELNLSDSYEGSEAAFYSVIAPVEELNPGEITEMTVIAAYDNTFVGRVSSFNKKATATVNYVRK